MSNPSIAPARATDLRTPVSHGHDEGAIWVGSFPPRLPHRFPEAPSHGCNIVRRIVDDLGREWRVRQLRSESGRRLLFQCAVSGVPSEVRAIRGHLESMPDDELVVALLPTDD